MTNIYEAKQQIVEIGRRMWTKEWVAANDGNISCKISDDEFVCTPTGVSKGFLDVGDLIIVDREGRKRAGGPLKPSSEIKMHLFVYRERPDVQAVCHAHPPTATGFAVAGLSLDQCVLPEVVALIGQIPTVPYGLPSTDEIPQAIAPYVKTNNAVLLANHGALSWGDNLMQAYYRMETMEHFAKILLVAIQLGKVNVFSRDQVAALESLRDRFGLQGAFTGCNVNTPAIPVKTGAVLDVKHF
ncbi:MAG: class II aldolase/adducin family protein [Candidatus Omnitrophota bacterium]|jgi:L-fuculose-phosphate aldolase|nr:MAG: class II aldolase/adducin family protein [Candidatus Omnitrophota bacterium]